jgi:hypothetical protein
MRPTFPFVLSTLLASCHSGPKTFDSNVTVERLDVVHRDNMGAPVSTDVSLVWASCVGAPRERLRGGQAFSSCIGKQTAAGATVPVKVLWEWDDHAHYDWHVIELAGCKVERVDDDDSSYDMVAECRPAKEHDAVVGFHCDRTPEGEMIQQCPWFRRE